MAAYNLPLQTKRAAHQRNSSTFMVGRRNLHRRERERERRNKHKIVELSIYLPNENKSNLRRKMGGIGGKLNENWKI